MSNISSSNSGGNEFQTIQDTFGESLSVDDMIKMQERGTLVTFLNDLYGNSDISEDAFNDFIDNFETECDSFKSEAYGSHKELEAMIESGNLSISEIASIELLMQDLQEVIDACDDGFSSDWGDAQELSEYLNQEVEAGGSTTINFDEANDGDVIKVDASAVAEDSESGSHFDAETDIDGDGKIDLADVNNDGVIESHELIDTDGDGKVDYDLNGDGEITEADDPNFDPGYTSSTVIVDGTDIESISLSSYDDSVEPSVSTFKVVKDDGTVCYMELTGDAKIIMSPVPENIESIPADLLSRIFEFTDSKKSYDYYQNGASSSSDVEYYTNIDMNDTDNSYNIAPSTDDFANGREYTVEMDSGKGDVLDINLSSYNDAQIEFTENANGDLVLNITTDQGEISITLIGLQYSVDVNKSDLINITGGEITSDSFDLINNFEIPNQSGNEPLPGALANLFTLDGSNLETAIADGSISTSDGDTVAAITTYSMAAEGNNVSLNPTSDDFTNGLDYTINFEDGASDTLDLNFPSNAKISFTDKGNGNLMLTVTTPDGSITITINGAQHANSLLGPADDSNGDLINITGGEIVATTESYEELLSMSTYSADREEYEDSGFFMMIHINGTALFNYAYDEDGYLAPGFY